MLLPHCCTDGQITRSDLSQSTTPVQFTLRSANSPKLPLSHVARSPARPLARLPAPLSRPIARSNHSPAQITRPLKSQVTRPLKSLVRSSHSPAQITVALS